MPPLHKFSGLQIINLLNYCREKCWWGLEVGGVRGVAEVPFMWKVTFQEQRAFPSWPSLFMSKPTLHTISNLSTGGSNDSSPKGLHPARRVNKAPIYAPHYLQVQENNWGRQELLMYQLAHLGIYHTCLTSLDNPSLLPQGAWRNPLRNLTAWYTNQIILIFMNVQLKTFLKKKCVGKVRDRERKRWPRIRCGDVVKNEDSGAPMLGFESCPFSPQVGDLTSLSLSFLLCKMVIIS